MKASTLAIIFLLLSTPGLSQECLFYSDFIPENISPLDIAQTHDFALAVSLTQINGRTIAYVAVDDAGLDVVDISNPSDMQVVDRVATTGDALDVVAWGPYAFIADNATGIHVIHANYPAAAEMVATVETPGPARNVAFTGSFLLVACWEAGLQFLDMHNPKAPEIGVCLETPGRTEDLAIRGDYAFVADGNGGLQVVNIEDPQAPFIAGELVLPDMDFIPLPDHAQTICLADGLAFLGSSEDVVYIVDISDPELPVLLGNVTTPSFIRDLIVLDSYLYVANDDGGMTIIEFQCPENPQIIGSFRNESPVWGLAAIDNIIFAANGNYGFLSLIPQCKSIFVHPGDADNNGQVDGADVLALGAHFLTTGLPRCQESMVWSSQPVTPWKDHMASYADTDGNGVVDEQDLFAIGLNWGRVHENTTASFVFDTTDPALAMEHREAFTTLYNCLTGSSEAALAMKSILAEVLDISSPLLPEHFVVHQNHPNPFNPQTTIRFELPQATQVNMNVYDARGQLVKRVIADRFYPPGSYSVEVSTDQLSSGVYFYHLTTGESDAMHKMMVVK